MLFLSTSTGFISPVSKLYSAIALTPVAAINQYNLSFCVSVTCPIHLALVKSFIEFEELPHSVNIFVLASYDLPSFLWFPVTFCTDPTSEPSDVIISTFWASLYSPLGTSLSSKSLFIRPARKWCFNSGISY